MRRRSPSRIRRFGRAGVPLMSTLPPSQARLASERVLNRQATSSHTSTRMGPLPAPAPLSTSDEHLDFAPGAQHPDKRLGLLLRVDVLQVVLDLRAGLIERDRARRLL